MHVKLDLTLQLIIINIPYILGTGKTLLARAVASQLDANFLKVVSSAIVDKYIGKYSTSFSVLILSEIQGAKGWIAWSYFQDLTLNFAFY